jgi:hypothetical protein
MATTMTSLHATPRKQIIFTARFARWLRSHRGAMKMAGLLSSAAPIIFFTSAISVMREPTTRNLLELTAWFTLLGAELWALLLLIGYALQHAAPARRYPRTLTLAGACVVALIAELCNGRGHILVEQGVAQSVQTMHAYALFFDVIMALLFFAHLNRSRAQEEAAARLAAAQSAQHEARRRLGQARLQALQARIDPHLLFEMLDAVRLAYQSDPPRAECLLDELATFLRAALPRLRHSSSSVLREARLARAYAQLRMLADASDIDMRFDVSDDVANARFPPGVLLPLLDDALRARAGACGILASRQSSDCELVLTLPARPLDAAIARVRSLLADLYGASANLVVAHVGGVASATVKVPYELA